MDIDRIADYLGTFYRPAEHPALDAQLRLWRETRPFAGAKLLDGTPVFRNTMVKYLALLAGGLLKVIRYNGGIEYMLRIIERGIHGRRGAEYGIALLVSAVNLFTANNTVAIVIAGPIARDISRRYGVAPERSASILDSASCIVQGMLPYGAQILTAIGAASAVGLTVSPMGRPMPMKTPT